MGRLFVVFALVLSAAAPLVAGRDVAHACYCRPREPQAYIQPGSAVLRGTVQEIGRSTDGAIAYVFEPSAVWQGEVARPMRIYDVGGSCMSGIQQGKEYLVATGRDQFGDHRVSSCHLVREVSGPLPDDLQFLGEPLARFEPPPAPPEPERVSIIDAPEPDVLRPIPTGGARLQSTDENAGLQADWRLAIVAAASVLGAAAVVFVGRRT
jgi:hypothetical protein